MPQNKSQAPVTRATTGESGILWLFVSLGVAALLTAIALPSYRGYTLHTHVRLAQDQLLQIQSVYASWHERNPGRRLNSLEEIGYPAGALYLSADGSIAASAHGGSIYRISASSVDATPTCNFAAAPTVASSALIAEPIQSQRLETECGTLCLSAAGERAASGPAGAAKCWEQAGHDPTRSPM